MRIHGSLGPRERQYSSRTEGDYNPLLSRTRILFRGEVKLKNRVSKISTRFSSLPLSGSTESTGILSSSTGESKSTRVKFISRGKDTDLVNMDRYVLSLYYLSYRYRNLRCAYELTKDTQSDRSPSDSVHGTGDFTRSVLMLNSNASLRSDGNEILQLCTIFNETLSRVVFKILWS